MKARTRRTLSPCERERLIDPCRSPPELAFAGLRESKFFFVEICLIGQDEEGGRSQQGLRTDTLQKTTEFIQRIPWTHLIFGHIFSPKLFPVLLPVPVQSIQSSRNYLSTIDFELVEMRNFIAIRLTATELRRDWWLYIFWGLKDINQQLINDRSCHAKPTRIRAA